MSGPIKPIGGGGASNVRRIGESSSNVRGISTSLAQRTISRTVVPKKGALRGGNRMPGPRAPEGVKQLAHASYYSALTMSQLQAIQDTDPAMKQRYTYGATSGLSTYGLTNSDNVITRLGTIGLVEKTFLSPRTGEMYF